MLQLVAVVLFLHCVMHRGADGQNSRLLYAPIDDALHQSIHSVPGGNFMESMTSVFETINSYDTCLVTSKQEWRNLRAQSHFLWKLTLLSC